MSAAAKSKFFPICKIDEELRIVKGPVLRPEIRDRQKTIISAKVIRDAAHDFVARLNAVKGGTKPGFMHTDFSRKLTIVESWITDTDLSYPVTESMQKLFKVTGEETVTKSADTSGDASEYIVMPAGTWMMAFRVDDDEIWQGVKDGIFKGFSIGGVATIQYGDD